MLNPVAPAPRAVAKADLNRLMSYHDQQFVELAYRLILGRPADPEGLAHYLGVIRAGESRREIAYRLGTSAEAKDSGFDPRLFNSYRLWRGIERIPLLGNLVLIAICLVRFRHVVREFRRLQNAIFGGLPAGSMSVPK